MFFSFNDYQNRLREGLLNSTGRYAPFMRVNRVQYSKLEKQFANNNNSIGTAFQNLRRRTSSKYFRKVYTAQIPALEFAQTSFPAYRFLLPEILTNDWLAIMDWHKFQRDHALHQPLTAYIVQKLLDENNPMETFKIKETSLIDHFIDVILEKEQTKYLQYYLKEKLCFSEEKLFERFIGHGSRTAIPEGLSNEQKKKNVLRQVWKGLINESAYIAALFHDMGYPWQFINNLNNKIKDANFSKISAAGDTLKIIETYKDRLLFYPFRGYSLPAEFDLSNRHTQLVEVISKCLIETHGFPGAISFLYLNDILNDYPNHAIQPLHQFCIEWAAMAIMMHDLGKIYWKEEKNGIPGNPFLQLKFEVDPLSTILTLADLIEDFERPSSKFTPYRSTSTCKYDVKCIKTELIYEEQEKELTIKYHMKGHAAYMEKKKFLIADTKVNFHPDMGYLDLSSLGIDNVTMIAEEYLK